ncbi:MAG: hypothetical protein IPG79_06640 [Saprospiraceae bacterium]|nr:hypothetical protein [Saprospiraceae bacterium]
MYQKKKPAKTNKILHWKYGMTREAMKAKKRRRDPYLNFQSNNFIIPASVFEKLPFRENVEGYGYEDLQYADVLKKAGVSIFHIDNPVYHEGLEINTKFIQKTKKSIENLIFLEKKKQIPETRLLRFYNTLSYYGLISLFKKVFNFFRPNIEKNMVSSRPSVTLFNLWKLYLYIQKK